MARSLVTEHANKKYLTLQHELVSRVADIPETENDLAMHIVDHHMSSVVGDGKGVLARQHLLEHAKFTVTNGSA